jgi:signal transduction histidine kinase/AmiR/NasT family two-component response regulator
MKTRSPDVFFEEAQILERARAARGAEAADAAAYAALAEAYERLLGKAEKMVRLADGMQNKLHKSQRALQAAVEAKSAYLAFMSHEVRNPLSGIFGLCELLEEERLEPTARQAVEDIQAACGGVLHLLNDTLDLSKIEAGQMQLESVAFSPAELVHSLVRLFLPRCRLKGIELSAQVAQVMPGLVRGDPNRLRQALMNLVVNAIKFTEVGGVRVAADVGRELDEGWELAFEVRDTGIGMDRETLRNLFKPYRQASAETARRYGGTGLGLSIAQRLANLMGGSIEVDSEPGKGTCFRLAVRVGRSAEAPSPESRGRLPETAPPVAVLVADDERVNRLVVKGQLAGLGCKNAKMVADGEEVLDELGCCGAAKPSAARYDLLLLDLTMQRLDGDETARRVRRAEAQGRRFTPGGGPLRIVALTGHPNASVEQACLAAGMDGVLQKPADRAELLRELVAAHAAAERA